MTAATEDPATPTSTAGAGGIIVEDLRIGLTARPGVDVVDDIDLVLKPGEVVGILSSSSRWLSATVIGVP